jgi:hypothetical protein
VREREEEATLDEGRTWMACGVDIWRTTTEGYIRGMLFKQVAVDLTDLVGASQIQRTMGCPPSFSDSPLSSTACHVMRHLILGPVWLSTSPLFHPLGSTCSIFRNLHPLARSNPPFVTRRVTS